MRMKGILGGLFLVFGLAPLAFGASNLYKMRNGAVIQPNGQELIMSTNTFCTEFSRLQAIVNAMANQKDGDDYQVVADQWGVLDPSSNAVSEPHAEAMYLELLSMTGNTAAAIHQWCGRIRQ